MNISRRLVVLCCVFFHLSSRFHTSPTRKLLNFKDSSDRKQLEHEMNFEEYQFVFVHLICLSSHVLTFLCDHSAFSPCNVCAQDAVTAINEKESTPKSGTFGSRPPYDYDLMIVCFVMRC